MFNNFSDLLEILTPEKKPLWGKMTPQHMIEHLIMTMQMSNGKIKFKCLTPPERLPVLKRFLLSNKPMPKLYINPAIGEKLFDLKFQDLDEAKKELRKEIQIYYSFFLENPGIKTMHMIFGELNKEEWEISHKKHFTHHLSQFGLM